MPFLTLISYFPANAAPGCFGRSLSAVECSLLCAANHAAGLKPASVPTLVAATQKNALQAHDGNGMIMPSSPAAELLMREMSGTSVNPESISPAMYSTMERNWNLTFMADGFVTETQQTAPRGRDKLYSSNVFMGTAQHAAGRGSFLLDVMLSLEPATISDRRYPLLFQTGETAYGLPIEDGQHPHNFVMGLGVHYAYPAGANTIFEAYFAPVGDPALGPIAYPHRASASEIPQAPIGHHWEDSTHISYDVLTAGVKHGIARLELSGFHGAEPGENRWNISAGAIDSWAARFSLFPAPAWAAQVSVGRLTHPEALEPGDIVRTTASIEYSRRVRTENWSTTFLFGRNHKTATGQATNALLLESVFPFNAQNLLTGRWELVDKDDLFAAQPALEQQLAATVGTTFRIGAYTLGFTHYVQLLPRLDTGLGANFSAYTLPAAIQPYYGAHPVGVNLYLHIRLPARR